ncbi:MAG TPA: hypothetical protein PKV41_01780 [Candidatus Omnitrophota bacterium]|nr:hypothetical protein [Candidatus Omnitrophota bacterium]
MIKKLFLLLCILTVLGCTYGQDYLEDPGALIRDPHFADYSSKRDDLELQYLRKEITYADYVQQRDELDQKYDKEVQERNQKIQAE